MKRTHRVTAALFVAAFGAAACSKSDNQIQPQAKNPQAAQEKPAATPPMRCATFKMAIGTRSLNDGPQVTSWSATQAA